MRIAFIGDSLTEGWPGASYFEILRDRLPDHKLFNHGHGGDTVPALWSRLQASGLEPVDLAFVWVGVNDAFQAGWESYPDVPAEDDWWRASVAHIAAVYDQLLDWLSRRSPAVFCVPPLLPEGGVAASFERRVRHVAQAIVEVAVTRQVRADPGLELLDLGPVFAAAREEDPALRFTTDGVHLSERGAAVVAAAFAQAIATLD